LNEEEIIQELNPEEEEKVEKTPDSHKVVLKLRPFPKTLKKLRTFTAVCHTWFIVKDKESPINWRLPLV
jgi:hypothetical protein